MNGIWSGPANGDRRVESGFDCVIGNGSANGRMIVNPENLSIYTAKRRN